MIRLRSTYSPETILELRSDTGTEGISLTIKCRETIILFHVNTKDLVMAIKQIEEERDAEIGTFRPDSKGSWAPEHERGLKHAVCKAEAELREVFRDSRIKHIYPEDITTIERHIYAARSIKEVEDIVLRVKEIYLSPVGKEVWGKSFDCMEDEKISRKKYY